MFTKDHIKLEGLETIGTNITTVLPALADCRDKEFWLAAAACNGLESCGQVSEQESTGGGKPQGSRCTVIPLCTLIWDAPLAIQSLLLNEC